MTVRGGRFGRPQKSNFVREGEDMKSIGILGGLSWESTAEYYRRVNLAVRERRGGLSSASLHIRSFDFAEIARLQRSGRWDELESQLAQSAEALEAAGANTIVIASNLMHKTAPAIVSRISVPLLHIVDAVGEELRSHGIRRVGILGARFTMEDSFYQNHLREFYSIEASIPDEDGRSCVHRLIYEELCCGIIREESRQELRAVIERFQSTGIEAVVLACTELCLLLEPTRQGFPIFDSTELHVGYIVNWISSE